MDEHLKTEYDVIVYGTGLVECLVAGAAARIGKTVLHLDSNSYYGGQWASFSLSALRDWVASLEKEEKDDEPETGCGGGSQKNISIKSPKKIYTNVKESWLAKEVSSESLATWKIEAKESISQDSATTEAKEDASPEPATAEAKEEATNSATISSPANNSSPDTPNTKQTARHSQDSLLKDSRKFNIDLAPKILYSRGPMVELLISSNVARYVEFKSINRILCWLGDSIAAVPCSRSQVFSCKSVSLLQKRRLMMFMQFAQAYKEQTERWTEYKDEPLRDFLTREKITDDLQAYIIGGMAMRGPDVTVEQGLEAINLFLRSLGRYGPSAFLSSLYGSGELPQAFCRLCAVFEGTYVLERDISSLCIEEPSSEESAKVVSVTAGDQTIKCRHLVIEGRFAPQEITCTPSESVSRAIFIVAKDLLQDFSPIQPADDENEEETSDFVPKDPPPASALCGVAVMQLTTSTGTPVTILQFAADTGTTAPNTWLLHMTCQGSNAERDLQPAMDCILEHYKKNSKAETDDESVLLYSLFFNQALDSTVASSPISNLFICRGPDSSLDYDAAVTQARSIIGSMYPDEEFMPRAPDPEEIIFEDTNTSAKEEDNSSEQNKETKSQDGEENSNQEKLLEDTIEEMEEQ